MSGRVYSDPAFGTNQYHSFGATGSLAGTAAIAVKGAVRFATSVKVEGFALYFVAGGTTTAQSAVLGKSLAGTGAFSAIGTIVVGTQATDSVKLGTVSTSFAAGDVLVCKAGGTDSDVTNIIPMIRFREEFTNA